MSIEVKTWKPANGCKSCMDAQRIMRDQVRVSTAGSALAIKKIREQATRIEELEHRLAELEEGNSTK